MIEGQPPPIGDHKIATGFNEWYDTVRNVTIRGLSPSGIPLTYQKDDSAWATINTDWVQVNDDTWKVENCWYQTWAYRSGWAYFVLQRGSQRHAIGIRPRFAVRIHTATKTIDTVLALAQSATIEQLGSNLIYGGIFPGVTMVVDVFNTDWTQTFIFSQEVRDSLATLNWGGRCFGIVSEIDLDSLNLNMIDDVGENDLDRFVDWVQFHRLDTCLFTMRKSWLRSSNGADSVIVRKRLYMYEGKPYLIEFFDPKPTAAWPEGTLIHNAQFGAGPGMEESGSYYTCDIIQSTVAAPGSDGTLDSAKARLKLDAAITVWFKMGLYEWASDSAYPVVDTTDSMSMTSTTWTWYKFDFEEHASVSNGTNYAICVWSTNPFGGCAIGPKVSGGTEVGWTIYTHNKVYGAWPASWDDHSSENNKRINVVAYYTEAGGPPNYIQSPDGPGMRASPDGPSYIHGP